MKAAHYDDIGLFLKDSRESLGVSIAEAAKALHIRPTYLRALEAGKLEGLPGKTYARGYIKTYSAYLGIDAAELLAEFDARVPGGMEGEFIPEPTMRENLPTWPLLILAAVGAVSLLLYYFLFAYAGHVEVVRVKEVPAQLMLRALALNDPAMKEWNSCLISNKKACFFQLRQESMLDRQQQDYSDNFRLLMPQ